MEKEPAFVKSLQQVSMDKGRNRFFIVFLLVSSVLWFFTKFSKEYTEVLQVNVSLEKIPSTVIPILNRPLQLEMTLKASGFQFLYYQFFDQKVRIHLNETSFEGGMATVPLAAQFQDIQDQLLGNTEIINYFPTELEFDYQEQYSKKVPIRQPKLKMALGFTATRIDFEPDSILIIGPQDVIKSKRSISPIYTSEEPIRKNLVQYLALPEQEKYISVDHNQVLMSVEVDRFSEKKFLLPLVTQNFPKGKVYKWFPSQISVSFTAPLNQLKEISEQDFSIGIDYNKVDFSGSTIDLEVFKQPSAIKNFRWEPKTVAYLIRQ